jgi:two-component system nitrate/nitrite sensor histidine kinase NarX
MFISLRARMGLLFLAFFLLLSLSAVATFAAIDGLKQDALVVNLAGRQRMLIQQMLRDALHLEHHGDDASVQSLMQAAQTFESTLTSFLRGGTTTYPPGHSVAIPQLRDAETQAALQQVQVTWATFRTHLDQIVTSALGSPEQEAAIRTVEGLAPGLMQQADEVVRRYETAVGHKLARLRWIQVTFLIGALLLLLVDFLLLHRLVVHPLQWLGSAAGRIGAGDLNTPVEPVGPREIKHLARSFDQMRAQLQSWTEELEIRVAQRTRELAALHEISREITSQLEVEHVLQSVTDKARVLLGGEVASLCLLDEPGRVLHSSAISGPQEALSGNHTSAHCDPAYRVLAGKGALPCGADECKECCSILAAPFRQSHLVAPLRVSERVIGALCVGGVMTGQFPTEAVHLLTELANSAAIAVENARLYARAERLAALEERQRIAAEMHDGLAQMLSYLGLQVDQMSDLLAAGQDAAVLEQLQRLRGTIEQASVEVRRAITSLHQDPQPPQALQERLAGLAAELTLEGEPTVDLVLTSQDPLLLPHDLCAEVLRVVGEALLNARRHARARKIWVRVEQSDGEAFLMVEDDGQGFDLAAPREGSRRFGLDIMRARAARLGGRLAVDSRPGQGTRVTLTWPLGEV